MLCCLQATIYCYPSTGLRALSLMSPQLGTLLICSQSPFWMVTAAIGAYSDPLQRQRQDVRNVTPPPPVLEVFAPAFRGSTVTTKRGRIVVRRCGDVTVSVWRLDKDIQCVVLLLHSRFVGITKNCADMHRVIMRIRYKVRRRKSMHL